MRTLDRETQEAVGNRCLELLMERYLSATSDSLLPLRALHDAKTIAVVELVERGWSEDDAWRRVSKFRVDVEDEGRTIKITDEWDDDA